MGGISIAAGVAIFHLWRGLHQAFGGPGYDSTDVFFLEMVAILIGGGLYLLIRGRSALGED
jgi:hypothetical protein